ncbi:MAG: DNA repair protein RecO [Pyrinomonadaceae bacterium]
MPLFESESLVLKSYNLAEADRIVVFFTRDHGIVRGVAKGAKRLNSRFGSTLELFSTVNLNYFQKEERELVSIQHVELVRSCFTAASDPEFLHTFSYIADLLMAVVPPHDPSETLYRMTKACLDSAVESTERLAAIRLYFELWLLRLGGYLPDWSRCDECERQLIKSESASMRNDFQLVCEKCRGTRRLSPVSPIHLEVFHSVQKVSPPKFLELTNAHAETVIELSAILRRIITQVVGRDLMNERTIAVNS